MKKLINKIATATCLRALEAKAKLMERKGQFVMEHAVAFIIIIVLGALGILLLTTYMQGDLSNMFKGKVEGLFN